MVAGERAVGVTDRAASYAAYDCQAMNVRRTPRPGRARSGPPLAELPYPSFAAPPQRKRAAAPNMGSVQFRARSTGIGLARQHAIGSVQSLPRSSRATRHVTASTGATHEWWPTYVASSDLLPFAQIDAPPNRRGSRPRAVI